MQRRFLHIMMLGLRGFPDVQGGIETHAENLCPRLVKLGCKVTLLSRSPYQSEELETEWKGVKIVRLWCPKIKSLEAIVHTFIGVVYAATKQPDILHIHAIGPSIMVPIAKLLGLRVVVTHHGPDYDRQKWGRIARFMLRAGERFGMRFADVRIVISEVIRRLVMDKHGVDSVLIPNGVNLPKIPVSTTTIEHFRLQPRRYIVLVSRFVPEKRHSDLIQAFAQAKLADWKLVLVGKSDHPDIYTQSILDEAKSISNVVCTGFQSGAALNELYAHAGIFVLPSSHEGLPIALLEALSYGLPVLASNIAANLEVGLSAEHYFSFGNIDQLTEKLKFFSQTPFSINKHHKLRHWVKNRYNWDSIAGMTLDAYSSTCLKIVENETNYHNAVMGERCRTQGERRITQGGGRRTQGERRRMQGARRKERNERRKRSSIIQKAYGIG